MVTKGYRKGVYERVTKGTGWLCGGSYSTPILAKQRYQWFSLAAQFSTTDIGVMAVFSCVFIRNLCPSLLTS
jgi:hypothetical protein